MIVDSSRRLCTCIMSFTLSTSLRLNTDKSELICFDRLLSPTSTIYSLSNSTSSTATVLGLMRHSTFSIDLTQVYTMLVSYF